jgi:type I restriction enzyme R subunit
MRQTNFSFLEKHASLLFQLARSAEQAFVPDPNTCLIKLRQLGEVIAKDIASKVGVEFDERVSQLDLLKRIQAQVSISQELNDTFHSIRRLGNDANHQYVSSHHEAKQALQMGWRLCVWYHQAFGNPPKSWKSGAFQVPEDPGKQLRELEDKVAMLERERANSKNTQNITASIKAAEAKKAKELECYLAAIKEEKDTWEQIAQEQEENYVKALQAFEKEKARVTELQKAQSELAQQHVKQAKASINKTQWDETEADARIRIDQQLRDNGWDADTERLSYKNGARPEKDKNKAIAEWPTGDGRADYILFVGLTPIAAVEAKRKNIDVSAKIPQAQRYSRGFTMQPEYTMAWQEQDLTVAWPDDHEGHYHIPFVYSCNGRPYVKQFKEKSGIWFRDVRKGSNLSDAHPEFHSPAGLMDKLLRSKQTAEEKLKQETFAYLGLRDYQEKAVRAVEAALAKDAKKALLAMATGTGKTRTIIGLIYRFLKAERFKRILFLVDRTSLGNQAYEAFIDTKLEQNKTLNQIYNINNLGDMQAEAETRVHVSTVQAMVRRIDSDENPAIDTYDCIIVDEAHRGYTLDQDMSEGEALVRDSKQYLSAYGRVIDYFDAFKVGLTATPAAHTTEVFGKPVYTYTYREAVADDWLIDHEPPFQYKTELNSKGIKIKPGDQIALWNTESDCFDTTELEDELNFDVESFNRTIITPEFDAVVAKAFAQRFDPNGDAKALVFCVNQAHAERFKVKLDAAFKAEYENEFKAASVQIMTGVTDKIADIIKLYKNERYPSVAITVDLLTTGIDVHTITHLLFMRRVKSRILYEQMKGRATRRCDKIGKTVFYIHDPVALYESLQDVDTMQPIVKDPNITVEQLIGELNNAASYKSIDGRAQTTHADDVLDQLSQKIMRVTRKAQKASEEKPKLKEKLDELQEFWQIEPKNLHKKLHDMGPKQASQFLAQHSHLAEQLDALKMLMGTSINPFYYTGQDELLSIGQGYGVSEKMPGDYLHDFNDFVKQQLNQHAAIHVVCNKPSDLTREQLREVRLLLDGQGYSEANLKSAWRNQTNQEIAASIIGYIRQAALGEPLIAFEQRVQKAMAGIYAKRSWTVNQKKWLERLAKQLVHEVVMDRDIVNTAFAQEGGAKRLEKVLESPLDSILSELGEALWSQQ